MDPMVYVLDRISRTYNVKPYTGTRPSDEERGVLKKARKLTKYRRAVKKNGKGNLEKCSTSNNDGKHSKPPSSSLLKSGWIH